MSRTAEMLAELIAKVDRLQSTIDRQGSSRGPRDGQDERLMVAILAFVGLEKQFGARWLQMHAVLHDRLRIPMLDADIVVGDDSARALGKILAAFEDRIVGAARLRASGKDNAGRLWRFESL